MRFLGFFTVFRLPLATRAALARALLLFLVALAALAATMALWCASARAVTIRNRTGETMGASGEGGVVRGRLAPCSLRASVEACRLALGGVAGCGVLGGCLRTIQQANHTAAGLLFGASSQGPRGQHGA